MKRILRHTYDAFPLLIFILFIHILLLRDPVLILVMSAVTAAMGLSLSIFRFKRVIWDLLSKAAFICILYFVMSSLLFEGTTEKVLFFVTSFTVMFFGRSIYRYALRKSVFAISIVSLILSIISFLMIRRNEYDSILLSIIVNAVIVINIIIIFFYNNTNEVASAIGENRKMPQKIMGSNRIMVITALAIVAAAALIREIVWLVETVAGLILTGIRELILLIIKLMSYIGDDAMQSSDGGEMQLPDSGADVPEPSIIWTILEYALYVLAGFIVLIGLYIVFRKLISLAKKLFSFLMRSLETGRSKQKSDYVDIVETRSVFDVTKENISKKVKGFIDDSSERYKAKSLREEIRYQYKLRVRKLKKHGFPFSGSMTAEEIYDTQHEHIRHEVLKRDFIDLYSTARYSEKEIENI